MASGRTWSVRGLGSNKNSAIDEQPDTTPLCGAMNAGHVQDDALIKALSCHSSRTEGGAGRTLKEEKRLRM